MKKVEIEDADEEANEPSEAAGSDEDDEIALLQKEAEELALKQQLLKDKMKKAKERSVE